MELIQFVEGNTLAVGLLTSLVILLIFSYIIWYKNVGWKKARFDREWVDDCANISGAVSPILEVEDPIDGAYDLEISSPGLDRPLVKLEDFNRYVGSEAQVETKTLLHGRQKFRGRLVGTTNSAVSVDLVDAVGVLQIPFAEIINAKLILTEDLLRVARKRDG